MRAPNLSKNHYTHGVSSKTTPEELAGARLVGFILLIAFVVILLSS